MGEVELPAGSLEQDGEGELAAVPVTGVVGQAVAVALVQVAGDLEGPAAVGGEGEGHGRAGRGDLDDGRDEAGNGHCAATKVARADLGGPEVLVGPAED